MISFLRSFLKILKRLNKMCHYQFGFAFKLAEQHVDQHFPQDCLDLTDLFLCFTQCFRCMTKWLSGSTVY